MICKNCKREFNGGDICPDCGTDNHNYTRDWLRMCESIMISVDISVDM